MITNFTLNSFNCRGLREKTKRLSLFKWIQANYKGITLLQETHSCKEDENKWEKEFNGKIYYSHGTSNSRGVAILIPSNIDVDINILKITTDTNGRILLFHCEIEKSIYVIVNIYAPTKDNTKAQNAFLNELIQLSEEYSDNPLIIGGDYNICLDNNKIKKGVP